MIIEIDSTEIIAYLIRKKEFKNKIEIKFQEIRDMANKIEGFDNDFLVTSDYLSIDAFRCAFSQYVKASEEKIVIQNSLEIRKRIERMQPAKQILNYLDKE